MVQLLHKQNNIHADLKVPPHSLEAEQAVLGGLMLSDQAWDWICDRVSEADFYQERHRLLFRACAALAEKGSQRDVVTMSEYLEPRGELEKAGGLMYLGALAKDTPSAANIKAYADIVRERSVLRQLIAAGEETAADAYSPGDREIPQLLSEAETRVCQIAEQTKIGKGDGYLMMQQVMARTIDRIDERFQSGNRITGIPMGLDAFDQFTRGFQNTDLIIVAGRPSMGKSIFMMNCVEHAALHHKKHCAVFSMEMSTESLGERMVASIGRIDYEKIQDGSLDDSDWPKLTAATTRLKDASIYIDDSPALTVHQVRARCRKIKRKHGLDMIAIDYIQLMQANDKKKNMAQQIGEISSGLKALAKEMNVPVIALSQLNRDVDSRSDNRPRMSDLRESGSLEQDADMIIFPYRDVVYNEKTKYPLMAEILIRKFRNGKQGKVHATAMFKYMKFDNAMAEVIEYEQYANSGRYDGKGGIGD